MAQKRNLVFHILLLSRNNYLRRFMKVLSSMSAQKLPPGQILLKVPNVKFDFGVSVGSKQLLTDTLKSNSTLGLKL